MEEKIKLKNSTLHRYLFTVTTFSKLLAMFLFILFPLVGFYLGMKYQQKVAVAIPVASEFPQTETIIPISSPTPTVVNLPSPTLTSIPTPKPIGTFSLDSSGNWKTITSSTYGFRLIFPAKGLGWCTPTGCMHQPQETECGNYITASPNQYPTYSAAEIIGIDSFFHMSIFYTDKTITQFTTDEKVQYVTHKFSDFYATTPIDGSNADEAILLKTINNFGYGGDAIPFSSTIALYRKNGKIYEIDRNQNSGLGCSTPNKGVVWDIPNSFYFP
jgi:hypothetical protein